MTRRGERGTTLVEVLISSVLGVLIVGASVMLMDSAGKLSDSAARTTAVAGKTDRVLWMILDDLRRCTLASTEKSDGTGFFDGDSDKSVRFALVDGYDGAEVVRGASVGYEFRVPSGSSEGEIYRTQNGVESLVARRIQDFTVTRNQSVFRVSVTAVAGPDDDRARSATATASVLPRNP